MMICTEESWKYFSERAIGTKLAQRAITANNVNVKWKYKYLWIFIISNKKIIPQLLCVSITLLIWAVNRIEMVV